MEFIFARMNDSQDLIRKTYFEGGGEDLIKSDWFLANRIRRFIRDLIINDRNQASTRAQIRVTLKEHGVVKGGRSEIVTVPVTKSYAGAYQSMQQERVIAGGQSYVKSCGRLVPTNSIIWFLFFMLPL